MCTNKIFVRNNSRYIDSCTSRRLYRFVNCGQCAECQKSKLSEYTLRLFYQLQYTLYRKGFALIDCLTYSPAFHPSINHFFDVPVNYAYKCFSSMDVRLFLVRLRQNLARLGYGSDCFSYYYVGEFGTDERFTKRAHYHIVFFVYCDISPAEFSILVSNNWRLGRTDGLVYRGLSQLNYNTLDSSCPPARLNAISSYLAKYLFKSQSLQKKSFHRAAVVTCHLVNKRDISEFDYSDRLLFRRVLSYLQPFHRQSKGFGLFALDVVGQSYIKEHQTIYFQSGSYRFEIGLPLYYVRKLFFKSEVNKFGSFSWIPNDDYRFFKLRSFSKSLSYLANSFRIFDKGRLDELSYRQFALDFLTVFGVCNFRSSSYTLLGDCLFNPKSSFVLDGVYNFTHPRFGLDVVSKYNFYDELSSLKFLPPGCVVPWQDFIKVSLADSQQVLLLHGFFDMLDLFLKSKAALGLVQDSAFDFKIKLINNLKNLSYAV